MTAIRAEALATIEATRVAGVKLAILSNELDLFYGPKFRTKLPFLADFDTIVDVTYTKILKPDPTAYRLCLDQLDLPAQACVFVDDQHRNIAGAQSVNPPTVHFDVMTPGDSYGRALSLLGLEDQA